MLCSLYLQRERTFPSTADWDSSVDCLDLEHDIKKKCMEKEKIHNAYRSQHRGGYKRNEKNNEYENEDLDAARCGHKSQRKMEGTGDGKLGGATMSPVSFNCKYVLESESLAIAHIELS
jgi:paired amphipathic helix protein Sin3a